MNEKIHITNIYGMIRNKCIVAQQNRIAKVGHRLGYLEMGIYNYPVEMDSTTELRRRIDGILASLEQGDIVFLQLPTGNGIEFDSLLFNKIKAYSEVKVVLLWHSTRYYTEHRNRLSILSDYEYRPDEIYKYLESDDDIFIHKMLIDVCAQLVRKQVKPDSPIHIGLGVHDKYGDYCSWVATTMQSIIDHTQATIDFHIVHDDTLTETNKKKFLYMLQRTEHVIHFHPIDNSIFEDNKEQVGIYTIGALYRVLLPEICHDLSRIIYLDSDLLVNCDIKELWDTDISNYCLAAVPDIDIVRSVMRSLPVENREMPRERYFNSGVIYMNLDNIRKKGNMRESIAEYLKKNITSTLPDQDALNVIYQNDTLLLDSKWNYFEKHATMKNEKKVKECIYHYAGSKPILYLGLEIHQIYLETVQRTPWGNERSKTIINRSIIRQRDRAKSLSNLITQISKSKKKYIFYGNETLSMKTIYKILSVSAETSYRVAGVKTDYGFLPCMNLSELNKEEPGSFIVFVLPEADSGHSISNLEKMGLTNEKDFFVIPNLLDISEGGYLL